MVQRDDAQEPMRNRSSGDSTWDSDGIEFHLKRHAMPRGDAARALKRGAALGIVKDRGHPIVEWIEVPVFEGSTRLQKLTRWLRELWDDPELYYTLWQSDNERQIVLAQLYS
ncbi:MAG: hypothetical protein ACOH1T_03320 [Microbacteriaceae bacterium]